jgi:hypothetical protein
VFVLLACVHTWPLARNPAHFSRIDNGDAVLNMWTVAWVGHELPRDPLHLFNANIFYPERLTLAYSEAMIVQGLMAVPVIAGGGSPVLAYNLALLVGFALTGWAFCLLLHRWTGSWGAGYVAGSLAAFNAHVLTRLTHLQALHPEFIALMLFSLDRLLVSQRTRDAVWLGAGYALEGLTSIYMLVFSTWMLLFMVVARGREWLRRDVFRTAVSQFAIAAAVGTVLLAPYLYGYFELHRRFGFERTIFDNENLAGSWIDYLSTGSTLHWVWSSRFYDAANSQTFPGLAAIVLVVLALAWSETRKDARVRMCAAAGVGCAIVSMLPRTPVFPLLYRTIPLFKAIRVEARLGQIVLLMIAVIAGYGVAGLRRRWQNRRTWPAVAAALFVVVNVEALRAPLYYRVFGEIPHVYDALAHERDAVVVELPFYPPSGSFRSAGYMLNSTRHWKPILNGYSGMRPGSYNETYDAIRNFPDVASMAALHERGVTHVVVHQGDFVASAGADRFDAIAHSPSLSLVAEGDDIRIYRLR